LGFGIVAELELAIVSALATWPACCNAPCGPRNEPDKILLYIDSGRANTQRRASHAGKLQRTGNKIGPWMLDILID
jgi:hypothetical protein